MTSVQLVVVGARSGGYAAAFLAADLGLSVALVDPEVNPGGVCVYRGCIPSKALLHVAKLLDESRHAKAWGIEFGEPKIDLDKLRAFKDNVVKRNTERHRAAGQASARCSTCRAGPRFVDPHNLTREADGRRRGAGAVRARDPRHRVDAGDPADVEGRRSSA